MHRIDSTNREQDKFGAGKDGFTEADPGVTAPTEITEEWLDAVQEEICNVIEGNGGTLAKGTRDQLYDILRAPVGEDGQEAIDATGGTTSATGIKGTGGSPNGKGVHGTGAGNGSGLQATGGPDSGTGTISAGGAGGGVIGSIGVWAIGGDHDDLGGTGVYSTGGDCSSDGPGGNGVETVGGNGAVDGGGGSGLKATGGIKGAGGGTEDGPGVVAIGGGSTNGYGVHATGTGSGPGVYGVSTSGHGGSFEANATKPAILVGSRTSAPSTPVSGGLFYNSTQNKFQVYANGAWYYLDMTSV